MKLNHFLRNPDGFNKLSSKLIHLWEQAANKAPSHKAKKHISDDIHLAMLMLFEAYKRGSHSSHSDPVTAYLVSRAERLLKKHIPQEALNKAFPIAPTSPQQAASPGHQTAPKVSSLPLQDTCIDFCCDKKDYAQNGVNIAKKNGATLIQTSPRTFVDHPPKFPIAAGSKITLMGHCYPGSNCLLDNHHNKIFASDIAKNIASQLRDKKAPFTINLVACSAATDSHTSPSFAAQLTVELAKQGVTNAKINASPTVMGVDNHGRPFNLSVQAAAKIDQLKYQKKSPKQVDAVYQKAFAAANQHNHFQKHTFSWDPNNGCVKKSMLHSPAKPPAMPHKATSPGGMHFKPKPAVANPMPHAFHTKKQGCFHPS